MQVCGPVLPSSALIHMAHPLSAYIGPNAQLTALHSACAEATLKRLSAVPKRLAGCHV